MVSFTFPKYVGKRVEAAPGSHSQNKLHLFVKELECLRVRHKEHGLDSCELFDRELFHLAAKREWSSSRCPDC